MTAVWLVQMRTRNAGIVDVAWALGVGMLALFFAATSPGDLTRRLLAGGLAAIWSARLTIYLYLRVVGHAEEGRYVSLRQAWGQDANRKLFWFFQMQAATLPLFALPILVAAYSPREGWNGWDVAGTVVWSLGVGGAALADWQLARFKRQADSRGKTCRAGLWRYSRHPNYFFEWLHWCAYLLLALGGPCAWLAAITPLVLLFFLLFVTGIPPTEKQALASRGDDYREYQRTTSPFVPWFPRK